LQIVFAIPPSAEKIKHLLFFLKSEIFRRIVEAKKFGGAFAVYDNVKPRRIAGLHRTIHLVFRNHHGLKFSKG